MGGHGRSWKGMDGHGRSCKGTWKGAWKGAWKVLEGYMEGCMEGRMEGHMDGRVEATHLLARRGGADRIGSDRHELLALPVGDRRRRRVCEVGDDALGRARRRDDAPPLAIGAHDAAPSRRERLHSRAPPRLRFGLRRQVTPLERRAAAALHNRRRVEHVQHDARGAVHLRAPPEGAQRQLRGSSEVARTAQKQLRRSWKAVRSPCGGSSSFATRC